MSQSSVEPLSRRDRLRADTVREIKETARRVLVDQGVDGLALRAVAREMGMSAPALYRYFDSREDLVEHVVADLYDELVAVLENARDAVPATDPGPQLLAVSRAFREWAITHHPEFGLLFGSPAESVGISGHGEGEGPAQEAAHRFGQVFGALVARIYLTAPFPIPADEDLDPGLRQELENWCSAFPVPLPVGAAQVFLSCWIRLYGMVAMEVSGHIHFALSDVEPMFEAELAQAAAQLGLST
jgi:AcrR family transcriptional regulator